MVERRSAVAGKLCKYGVEITTKWWVKCEESPGEGERVNDAGGGKRANVHRG
jgi:hypothetical protein